MSQDFPEEADLVVPRRVDWRLWCRILGHLKPYPKAVAMMIGGGSILAGVEVMLPLVTARIIDAASGEAGTAAQIPWWGGLYFAMLVVFALLVFLFIRAAGTLATGVAFDLRNGCFEKLQSLPFGFFDVRSTGWLVARVTSDVTKVTGLLPWFLLDIFWGALMLVGILVALIVARAVEVPDEQDADDDERDEQDLEAHALPPSPAKSGKMSPFSPMTAAYSSRSCSCSCSTSTSAASWAGAAAACHCASAGVA